MDSEAMITATKNEILQPQDWVFPVPIAYGPGRLTEIGSKAAALGIRNALIVTDRGSRDLPFIAETAAHLATAGVKSGVFLEISPNPRNDEIGAGKAAFLAGGHDAIIAIGGGSAMER